MLKFRIHLKNLQQKAVLPASYHYELASAIYKRLPFLEDTFYSISGFWFIPPFKYEGDRVYLENNCNFELGIFDPKLESHVVQEALTGKEISISDNEIPSPFEVTRVETLDLPSFNSTMRYEAISPISLRFRNEGEKHDYYVSPEDERFEEFLLDRVYQKHLGSGGLRLLPVGKFKLISPLRPRLITMKAGTSEAIRVKGWLFQFELTAPLELHQAGYFGGFGDFHKFGFGAVKAIK